MGIMTETEKRIESLTEGYSREELLKLALEVNVSVSKDRWEISNKVAQLAEKNDFLYMIIRALADK